MKVLSIEKVDVNTTLYDLQIKGLPYYYANNMVVHNSTPALASALASKGIDTNARSEITKSMKLDKASLQSVGLEITDKLVKRKNLRTQLNTYIKKFTEIDEGRIRYKLYDTATARLASGNDLKVKSRANYYFLPLNFQNLTKPSGGFYSCKENILDPKNILGYIFEYITDNTEELGVFRANNPEVKIVEGFSQKNNIRNAITTPNPKDDWVLCIDPNTLVETKEGSVSISSLENTEFEIKTPEGFKKAKNFIWTGKKQKCILTLKSGKKVICSPEHKFKVKTLEGELVWKQLKNVLASDCVLEL